MLSYRFLISVLVIATAAVPASATTLYCNQSNTCNANTSALFNTATAGLFFGSGFQNLTAANGAYSPGLLDADSISGLNLFGYNSSHVQIGVTVETGVLKQTTSGNDTSLQVQLPSNTIYAFGAHITVVGSAFPCIESISTVGSFDTQHCLGGGPLALSGSTEFIGVVDSSPLTSVFIGCFGNLSCGQLQILDFELGTQQAQAQVPEVATLVLIGSGLICLRLLRRRQRRTRP